MKKNIVALTGRDTYGIEGEVKKWQTLFALKHSSANIDRISLEEFKEQSHIWRQNILSSGLFAEKRLFLISGGNTKRDKCTDFPEFFRGVFADLPSDHVLLFHSLTDRGAELIDLIREEGDIRTFDSVFSSDLWIDRFHDRLDPGIIRRVVQRFMAIDGLTEEREKNTLISHSIAHTLTSLSDLSRTQQVSEQDIDDLIGDVGGGKIFDLVDAILAVNTKKALQIFERIALTKTMFEFLPSFLGLLRNSLYIKYLSEHHLPTTGVKVHPFVLKKTLTSRISLEKIQKLYTHLVEASIAYKSGKGMRDVELGRILAIELGILGLKK